MTSIKPNREPTIENPVVQIEGRAPTNALPAPQSIDNTPVSRPPVSNPHVKGVKNNDF